MRRVLVIASLMVAAAAAIGQPPGAFRFVHITDTHVAQGKNVEPLRRLVANLGRMDPKPAFVVNSGDVTELGTPEEFEAYKQAVAASPVPFYAVPGNHDVRWAPLGKEAFTALGKRYQSFDHGGCHFVLLDSTVLLEHWGHFDAEQLRWLEADLKRLKKGTPVFLFFHHPLGREGASIDNADDLLRVVAPYNVVAMLVGHGHSDLQWKVNGIQCVMARGLYQGTRDLVDVGPQEVRILRSVDGAGAPEVVATLRRAARPWRRVAFEWDDPNLALLERRRFVTELRVGDEGAHDDKVTAAYQVDGGAAQPMQRDRRDKESVSFVTQFPTKGLGSGAHVVRILLTAPDGDVFQRDEPFIVERLEGEPRSAWTFQTGNTIQSSPVLAGDRVYATSLDGKVYCLDAATGKRRWAAETKGPILGSPLVSDDAVYVGSMDHFLYAVDARSGKVRWRTDIGAPLFASPAISNGVVCIGGSRRISGVDARTGQPVWTQEAGGYFQSRAAAADGVFYLGGWDNTLYALDAATGQPRWKTQMGRSNGGRGTLMFYFSPAITSPAVADGRVYVCTNDGVLHAVNAQTGKDEWSARAPQGGDTFGYSSPLLANGRVYLGGLGEAGRGDCYALDAKTGALVWRCSTGADNYDSSPSLAGSAVVIGSVQGKLSWIDAASGKLRHQYGLEPGFSFSSPAASATMTWMASMNSRVYGIATP